MSKCNYERRTDGRWTCRRCLRTTKSKPSKAPHGQCSVPGWGDRVKRVLEICGMTRGRWLAVKRALGIKHAKCGCGRRQEALNRLGDQVSKRTDPCPGKDSPA